jgi:UrcA family protein
MPAAMARSKDRSSYLNQHIRLREAFIFAKPAIYTVAFSLAAGFAVLARAPAPISSSETTVSIRVPYRDLDLRSPQGLQVLLFRISRAARQICGPPPADRLSFGSQYDACMKTTVDDALREMPVAEAQK